MEFLSAFFWEWTDYGFMRLALCAVLLMAPLYGLLGTMVVDGRMSFFSDSLGHSAMTGIALGVLLGIALSRLPAKYAAVLLPVLSVFQTIPGVVFIGLLFLRLGMVAVTVLIALSIYDTFPVLYALLLVYVKARGAASTDTTLGVFSATGMALGVVLLSRNGGFARYSNYLIGDLLAIEAGDLAAIGAALAATVVFWFAAYNRLLLLCVSPALAASRGVRVRLAEACFACLLAVVVMLSIRWVGTLIISAMLVLPAAAARNLARNVRGYHGLSVLLALVCGVVGLLLSFAWGTASGATIVLSLALCYALSLAKRRRGA